MIALIQRVTAASVTVADDCIGKIDMGIMALIGIEKGDSAGSADRLAKRILTYRIFPDSAGKMNLDIVAAEGALLLVPQFTLVADTAKGRRPGFSRAAPPDEAAALFDYLSAQVCPGVTKLERGQFGADMQVMLVNDGPVTFWLRETPDTEAI